MLLLRVYFRVVQLVYIDLVIIEDGVINENCVNCGLLSGKGWIWQVNYGNEDDYVNGECNSGVEKNIVMVKFFNGLNKRYSVCGEECVY